MYMLAHATRTKTHVTYLPRQVHTHTHTQTGRQNRHTDAHTKRERERERARERDLLCLLEATSGFAALESVGDLDIYSNPALTDVKGFSGLTRANLIRVHHNPSLQLIEGFEKLQTLGDDDDTEPALVVVENGDRGITMTAFGTLEHGGWAALQRGLDAPALCASRLVAQDETPCYCGDATDDCFEHADVIRDLTKYVDEDDDDDEDDVEAIAPAPRQAPPAGWGKLLSA